MNVPVAPPKVMTGNRQLTRGAFIRNDFLRNPHFRKKQGKLRKLLTFGFSSISKWCGITGIDQKKQKQ